MNKMLLEQLHRYTEDREIDYSSAQYLGESFGIVWKNQQQLVEFKQVIDTYLKTFSLESFAIVESKVNVLTGKNTRSTEEAEQLTVYAAEPKTLRKPDQRKVLKSKKKAVNESGGRRTIQVYTTNDPDEQEYILDLATRKYGLEYEVINDVSEDESALVQFSGFIDDLEKFFEYELQGMLEDFEDYVVESKISEERSYSRGKKPLTPADNKTIKKFDEKEYDKTRKNSIVDYQKKKKAEEEESERKSEIKSKIDALSPELKKHALDIYKVHPSWKASEIINTAKLRLKKSK